MVKSILYITNSTDENNTLGYRHSNLIKHLKDYFEIDLVDFTSTKERTFLNKVINKIFIFPDLYKLSLYKNKKKIRSKLENNIYDLVIIGVLPHSFLELASYIKKINTKLPVLVDMTDPLSINVSYLKYCFIYRLYIKWYETKHLKNVNKLVVLNDEIKHYYETKYPFLGNVNVLEQGIETYPNTSVNRSFIKRRKIELIYAGMLYLKFREPFELYKSIININSSIRLSIYGTFKKRFRPPDNKKFYFGGLIEKNKLLSKINDSDVIVFLDNFYGLQIPGKILENLAMNKPILFIYKNENSPTFKYVKDVKGIFFAKNDYISIIETIKIIEKSKLLNYKRNISKYYWENLIESFSYTLRQFLETQN